MEKPNLSNVFNDRWIVSGQTFPAPHREKMIAFAQSEAAILRNSVAIHRCDDVSGMTHYGFIHPDGHYSHASMDEETRGIR